MREAPFRQLLAQCGELVASLSRLARPLADFALDLHRRQPGETNHGVARIDGRGGEGRHLGFAHDSWASFH